MTLFTFVAQLILQPIGVHTTPFGTNDPASISLSLEMLDTRLFDGELCTEFNDIHKNYRY